MRLLFPVAIVLTASAATLPAKSPPAPKPVVEAADCPAASSQWVREGRGWQSKLVKPQKLAELPSADSYAAVYRLDERGCMVPVKFREVRR